MQRKQKKQTIQLTIRGVPLQVRSRFRQQARLENKSLNTLLVEVLSSAVGLNAEDRLYHDLDQWAGRWQEDPQFDKALREQDMIDESLWR